MGRWMTDLAECDPPFSRRGIRRLGRRNQGRCLARKRRGSRQNHLVLILKYELSWTLLRRVIRATAECLSLLLVCTSFSAGLLSNELEGSFWSSGRPWERYSEECCVSRTP